MLEFRLQPAPLDLDDYLVPELATDEQVAGNVRSRSLKAELQQSLEG